jgi:hypothetical protein
LNEDFKSKGKESRAKALALLTSGQSKRLKQIEIQATIASAITRPEIIKALDISDEQRAKIQVLRDDMEGRLSAKWLDMGGLDPKDREAASSNWHKSPGNLRVLSPLFTVKLQPKGGRITDLPGSIPTDYVAP